MTQGNKEEKIRKAIENSTPLIYKITDRIHNKWEPFFISALEIFLSNLKKEYLKEPLAYCLKEMMDNSEKANIKRIYFLEKALNIYDSKDYEKGMLTFKPDFMENPDFYLDKLKIRGYYTKIGFQVKDEQLIITVINNAPITEREKERIAERMSQAKKCRDIMEAFNMFQDLTESGGLGIITMILMLRGLGINDDRFVLASLPDTQETLSRISIPLSTVTENQAEQISKTITDEITSIPKFPDAILELESLMADTNIAFSEVGNAIMRDPSLTADLLKWVNSVQFMLPKKVSSIKEAITLVGIKGIRSLLYSYGVQKILSSKYGAMKKLWTHSYKVAFYSYQIARDRKLIKIVEDIYTAAILHDIGKIIVSHLHPEMIDKINIFCKEKGITGNFIENLTIGVTHAGIGAMLAKKWNFPENIAVPIEFHHQPLLSPDEHKDIVFVVYLANAVSAMERGGMNYSMLEEEVLKKLGISSEKQFNDLAGRLQRMYQDQQERFETKD